MIKIMIEKTEENRNKLKFYIDKKNHKRNRVPLNLHNLGYCSIENDDVENIKLLKKLNINFDLSIENDYDVVTYEDEKYYLIENAKMQTIRDRQMNETVFYSSLAISKNNNLVELIWNIKEEYNMDEDEAYACDWEVVDDITILDYDLTNIELYPIYLVDKRG